MENTFIANLMMFILIWFSRFSLFSDEKKTHKKRAFKSINELMHINGHFKIIFSRFEKPKHFLDKMKCCETIWWWWRLKRLLHCILMHLDIERDCFIFRGSLYFWVFIVRCGKKTYLDKLYNGKKSNRWPKFY